MENFQTATDVLFIVMSAQKIGDISGLVAANSLMAMVGGILVALIVGKNDPGFVHNGPLAGLVAVCAGSDIMHPLGALVTGGVAGGLFVWAFTQAQNRWKIDDVLGVWPLHGIRLTQEEEYRGADLSIHKIASESVID